MFFSDGGKGSGRGGSRKKSPCPQAGGGGQKRQIRFYIFRFISANLGYIKNLAGELIFISRNGENKFNVRNGGNSFEEGCQFIKIALADSEGCVTENVGDIVIARLYSCYHTVVFAVARNAVTLGVDKTRLVCYRICQGIAFFNAYDIAKALFCSGIYIPSNFLFYRPFFPIMSLSFIPTPFIFNCLRQLFYPLRRASSSAF